MSERSRQSQNPLTEHSAMAIEAIEMSVAEWSDVSRHRRMEQGVLPLG